MHKHHLTLRAQLHLPVPTASRRNRKLGLGTRKSISTTLPPIKPHGFVDVKHHVYVSTAKGEPVWLSGKALGWQAEGPRFDTASALLSLQKGCGLWTLSCDFVHHFLLKH